MKRRELIKRLGAIAGISIIPGMSVLANNQDVNFHFVGLGTGGTNVVRHVRELGIKGQYSCITWFYQNGYTPKGFKHIEYAYPIEFLECKAQRRKSIPLTDEMKSLLSENNFYVVFVGLGGFTGSSLILNVVKYLENNSINYLAICSLPFSEEGRWRNNYARQRKDEMSSNHKVKFHDNSQIMDENENISARMAFKLADNRMIEIFRKEIEKNYYL